MNHTFFSVFTSLADEYRSNPLNKDECEKLKKCIDTKVPGVISDNLATQPDIMFGVKKNIIKDISTSAKELRKISNSSVLYSGNYENMCDMLWIQYTFVLDVFSAWSDLECNIKDIPKEI